MGKELKWYSVRPAAELELNPTANSPFRIDALILWTLLGLLLPRPAIDLDRLNIISDDPDVYVSLPR